MSFVARRERLLANLSRPLVLFAGGALSRNYPANTFPFRADSNFLYFFERPEAGSAALFDPQEKTVTLFLPERSLADALWHGELEPFEAAKARHQVHAVLAVEALEQHLQKLAKGRSLDALAVADFKATQRARAITEQDLHFDEPTRVGRAEVLDAISALRLKKGPEELAEMRKTAVVTREAHLAAIRASRPGVKEELLAGLVGGAFARSGCVEAYGTILSVRGEVQHVQHVLSRVPGHRFVGRVPRDPAADRDAPALVPLPHEQGGGVDADDDSAAGDLLRAAASASGTPLGPSGFT